MKAPDVVAPRERFEVWMRINDENGRIVRGSEAPVTVRASGPGLLSGTLTRTPRMGAVFFDDLSYDAAGSVRLSLDAPGFSQVVRDRPLQVQPLLRFVEPPPSHIPVGRPMGRLAIEVVDGLGKVVPYDGLASVDLAGGTRSQATVAQGRAVLDLPGPRSPGPTSLLVRVQGLAPLQRSLTAHELLPPESIWLPAARVDAPYFASLPRALDGFRVLDGVLPPGLILEPNGSVAGQPKQAGVFRADLFAVRPDGKAVLSRAHVLVVAAPRTPPVLDALSKPGPFSVGEADVIIDVPTRGAKAAMRVFLPNADGLVPSTAALAWPVVIFQHGSAPMDAGLRPIYDRFDHLLRHWASYGVAVATVDALDLIVDDGKPTQTSLGNLVALSDTQRAAMAFLRRAQVTHAVPWVADLDLDRVVVAGHSRGAGASIITAKLEPSVIAGLLIKPVDPMATLGGERLWAGPLPAKPFLLITAGKDTEVPGPLSEFLYERRTAAMTAVTIAGSVHGHSCDDGCPPTASDRPAITREQDHAITNAFVVAFLKLFARGQIDHAPLLFGREGLSTALSPAGVYVQSDSSLTPLTVDDYQDGETGRNARRLANQDSGLDQSADEPSLVSACRTLPTAFAYFRTLFGRDDVLFRSNAHRLDFTAGGTYSLPLGGLDVSGRAVFKLRMRTTAGHLDAAAVSLRFVDMAGRSAVVGLSQHSGDNAIGPYFSDVIVPVRALQARLSLVALSRVDVLLSGEGSLLLDDVRFE